jgi:hypothetical protein
MTHDQSGEETDQTHTAEGNVADSAPVGAEPYDHGAHDEHGAHDAHGAHGEDSSEKSTLVPVTWRQLIFPALILLLVIILLIGPVSNAFAPRPASSTGLQAVPTVQPTATPASTPAGAKPRNTVASAQIPTVAVATKLPVQVSQPVQPTAIVGNPDEVSPAAAATRTAVAVQGENGQVTRAPVQLEFEGALFTVDTASTGILPDWKPSGDATHATWIQGTYANHIIYVTYSDSNAALFGKVKSGDTVKLTTSSPLQRP